MNSSVSKSIDRLWFPSIIGIVAIGVSAIAWHFWNPVEVEMPSESHVELTPQVIQQRKWELADFEGVWNKRLLADPPPLVVDKKVEETPQREVVVPAKPVPLNLVSIIYSEEAQIAVFKPTQSGSNEIVRMVAGDRYQDLELLRIDLEKVVVQFNGKEVELKLGTR